MDEDVVGTELRGLRRRRPEIAGTVLAGTDGLLISSDLPATDATHLAALAAASFGLGSRVADTARRGEFRESVVHTSAGCVVTYPVGSDALLTLVTEATGDLDALHADARAVARRAGSALAHRRPVGAAALPTTHGPLATRTPGRATLPTRRVARHPHATWRRPPV
ncbi:roadblock/LC7 domain-containing protein [Micromonospora sp. C28SCA-DRY-2]|uniref:roadblock/LC7 domain-containing protein n=1 Tax=Micromonospora sp. C28SCA-DRY-2 TaxID=3059522 RepID=UPI0026753E12|nr:roadblock/LC7 domain-containing protein [Micromonospora sp. C28SCA-DRY-2]MDO3701931.1 roadblock/LC7 domain-containing protein [Micromonospora sp. C28SCA-DRY-2]